MITKINEFKKQLNENSSNQALPVSVYRSKHDSTANGLTSKHDQLLLVFDGVSSPFNVKDDEDYLVLVKQKFSFGEHLKAVPKSILYSGVHSMFGGNFIYTSDSRFPSKYPIPVHDRVER